MTAKPRNAAGQFAPAADAPKRSPSERHAANKVELKQLEAARDSLTSQRNAFLLNDDRRAARRCSHALRELELALQEAHALDDLLLPEIRRERQQQAQKVLPTSREQAQARRLALQPRLAQLAAIRWDARHAGQQAEYDTLRQQDYYFAGLEKTLPSEAALSKESA